MKHFFEDSARIPSVSPCWTNGRLLVLAVAHRDMVHSSGSSRARLALGGWEFHWEFDETVRNKISTGCWSNMKLPICLFQLKYWSYMKYFELISTGCSSSTNWCRTWCRSFLAIAALVWNSWLALPCSLVKVQNCLKLETVHQEGQRIFACPCHDEKLKTTLSFFFRLLIHSISILVCFLSEKLEGRFRISKQTPTVVAGP